MKFIIFILASLCFTQTLAEAANKELLAQLGNCKTYTYDDRGLISGCGECHTGFLKNVNGNCVFDESKKTYPAHNCNDTGRCDFYEIKYNSANNQCGNEVDMIYVDKTLVTDIQPNPTCVACASFTANNHCEKCATGYILFENKCIPLKTEEQEKGADLFIEEDHITNNYCVHGEMTKNTQNEDVPSCEACTDLYYQDGGKCIKKTGTPTEGCVKMHMDNDKNLICTQCREGYVLNGNICKKIQIDKCVESAIDPKTGNVICTRCILGHAYESNTEQCEVCTKYDNNLMKTHFNGDECNLLDPYKCNKCNPNCKLDDVKQLCFSIHCDLFDSKNKCIRCEQGYVFDDKGNCIASSECRNYETGFCEDGYYESKEGDKSVCKKCKGKCKKCLSDEICLEGQVDISSGHALNGLPCFDPNCKLCSSEDPHVCLECKPSVPGEEQIVLKNGRCYIKYFGGYTLGSANEYNACRFYKEPTFSSDPSVTITGEMLNNVYVRQHSVAYTHTLNKDGDSYLCEHYDMIPYYFQHDGDTITCAGKNRDPHTDCECKAGYYAEDIHKFSDCKKFEKDPYCVKPLNGEVCGKCMDGLKIVSYKVDDNTLLECGCEEGFRPDENGVCVPCPRNCRTCRTDSDGKPQCLSCRGYAKDSIDEHIRNNYYREVSNLCECRSGYASFEANIAAGDEDIVYSCYLIPEHCTSDYTPQEYGVKCNVCPEEGYNPEEKCTKCLPGYYDSSESGSNKVICTKCPIFENEDGLKVSPCKTCAKSGDKVICTSCVDDHMDRDKNCQECYEGYSLKFHQEDDKVEPTPFCLQCESHCKEGAGCFLGKQGDTTTNEKGNLTNPYTIDDMSGPQSVQFCGECKNEGGKVFDHCSCPAGSLLVEGNCETCAKLFEDTSEEDVSGCDLEKSCSSSKAPNDAQHKPPYKCTVCKQAYNKRLTSKYCQTCPKGTYPAEPKNGNGGCEECPSYCDGCSSSDKCTLCPRETESSLVTGEKCDRCVSGYYFVEKTKSIDGKDIPKCLPCDSSCLKCEGTPKNCSVCRDSDHAPSQDKGCAQCIPGLYYDPFDGSCKKVDEEKQYGFTNSVLVCTNDKGALVDCTSVVNEPNAETAEDERQKYNATERGLSCDTTITGVAPEPVEGLCVCKTGFHDNRTAEEIAASPMPVCLDDRLLTGDDFCVDAIENNDGTYACKKCNADYLEVKSGKCVCKNSHYTTSWGACIPCGRHNKGCKECSGKKQCTKCEDGYSLRDGACHAK